MIYEPLSLYLWNNSLWMSWNVFLGLIPLLLANHLFHPKRKMSFVWGLGVVSFILFLPNAPYIFTDIIHLFESIKHLNSRGEVVIATLQFLALEYIGFKLFAHSYHRFEKFVLSKKWYSKRYVIRTASFVIISIGVYLGRFLRFNSWDAFTKPYTILKTLSYLTTFHATFFIVFFTMLLLVLFLVHEKMALNKS